MRSLVTSVSLFGVAQESYQTKSREASSCARNPVLPQAIAALSHGLLDCRGHMNTDQSTDCIHQTIASQTFSLDKARQNYLVRWQDH